MGKKVSITDAELDIMNVLWESEKPLSAYEIRMCFQDKWKRTTILTLIERLVKKELVIQEKADIFYYSPAIKKEDYIKEETKNFIKKLYHGSSKDLIASLFQGEELTLHDLEELKQHFTQGGEKNGK